MQFRFVVLGIFFNFFLSLHAGASEDGPELLLKGSGWYQFGKIMQSSDTLNPLYNYNGNWIQNSGAQFTVVANINEQMQGAVGLGGMQLNTQQGAITATAQTSFIFSPYITEARFKYLGAQESPSKYYLDVGFFSFQPDHDNRNFGGYLLRGPVYPGILFSEFEAKSLDTTVANILGAHIHHDWGDFFSHDFIIRSEIEFPPVYDMSLIYLASIKIGSVFEIGTGVNFYRAIAMQPRATKLDSRDFQIEDPVNVATKGQNPHPYLGNYASIVHTYSTANPDSIIQSDTIMLSHQGIKIMGRFTFDLKPFFASERWHPMDLKLFAEAAIIGTKSYPGVYPNIMERIPVMMGFGIPTFGILDESVIEVEYYKAPFRDDYRRLMAEASPIPMSSRNYSPVRLDGSEWDVHNMHADDLKWSLYLSKTFHNSLKLSAQAANDHFRPLTPLNSSPAQVERLESAFTTTKDWYLMFRIGFAFN